MKLGESKLNCQIPCLQLVAEGVAQDQAESISRKCKLMIRRHLSPDKERKFKNTSNDYLNRLCKFTGRGTKPPTSSPGIPSVRLQDGDWVRVRSREEIERELNHWRQVRGCAFMPEMAEYCGTIHRVAKSMKRFVDERDLKVKKSNGIILLEGVLCRGTAEFGRCDRSCLHFWREEWLEKLDEETVSAFNASSAPQGQGDFVTVRPLREVEATLDGNRQLRGCTFLPEMAEYCGTTQRVLNRMDRFVDERDLGVKKSSGILLLQGVVCKGTSEEVHCDRCCHLMWRREWLEKVEEQVA
jgi:hypothetical protein